MADALKPGRGRPPTDAELRMAKMGAVWTVGAKRAEKMPLVAWYGDGPVVSQNIPKAQVQAIVGEVRRRTWKPRVNLSERGKIGTHTRTPSRASPRRPPRWDVRQRRTRPARATTTVRRRP